MIEKEKEKCSCCNGSGKRQVWDDKQNKWAYTENSPVCSYCKGEGEQQYYIDNSGVNFLPRKIYV